MKNNLLTTKAKLLSAVVATFAFSTSTQAIHLDFAAVPGGEVQFNGNTDSFTFLPTTGAQFSITSSDGAGDSLGLFGRMDGTFDIGAITSTATFFGPKQTASVTGTGTLRVDDGFGNELVGVLVWDSITTLGTSGAINVSGALNLTSIAYTGPRLDLLALAAPGAGSETISFQFVPGKTLTQLTADGTIHTTSFSGSISSATVTVPDGGATLGMLGFGLLGMIGLRRQLGR